VDSNFDFLEVYDDTLSKEECDKLIKDFEDVSPLSGRKFYETGESQQKYSTTLYSDTRDGLFKAFNIPTNISLQKGIEAYKEKYSFLNDISLWSCWRYYNIQKYEEGQGYYRLHCEHDSADTSGSYRILAWMIYLNDAECGTEFPYQNKILDAKAGRLVIWPAAWSHPHKGVTPNKGLKYIATGWYNFNKGTTEQ
tara:strand:- start:45 stop:629 length:585 start_codon:yes stop_codon:yes gene_type:complete